MQILISKKVILRPLLSLGATVTSLNDELNCTPSNPVTDFPLVYPDSIFQPARLQSGGVVLFWTTGKLVNAV